MHLYREPLSPVQQLILLAVKDGRTTEESDVMRRLYQDVGDEALWRESVRNKVAPIVGHALMDGLNGNGLPDRWREAHDGALDRTTHYLSEMDSLFSAFEERAVRGAVIENGGIACGVYPCPGCFVSSDMELLIDREKLQEVHTILLDHGYEAARREGRQSDDVRRPDHDQRGWSVYRRTVAEGVVFWVNVMWRPVLRRWLPAGGEPDVHELLQRSIIVGGRQTKIRILAPEDNLILCALHTASHSYVRGPGLRLQLDVDRIVRRASIDWNLFTEKVMRLGVRTPVFPALAIPRGILGTPIPDWIFDALVSSGGQQRRILNRISKARVFSREGHRFGRLGFLIFEATLCDRGAWTGLRRAVFPPVSWMREGYNFRNPLLLPYYYGARLLDLAGRRSV